MMSLTMYRCIVTLKKETKVIYVYLNRLTNLYFFGLGINTNHLKSQLSLNPLEPPMSHLRPASSACCWPGHRICIQMIFPWKPPFSLGISQLAMLECRRAYLFEVVSNKVSRAVYFVFPLPWNTAIVTVYSCCCSQMDFSKNRGSIGAIGKIIFPTCNSWLFYLTQYPLLLAQRFQVFSGVSVKPICFSNHNIITLFLIPVLTMPLEDSTTFCLISMSLEERFSEWPCGTVRRWNLKEFEKSGPPLVMWGAGAHGL